MTSGWPDGGSEDSSPITDSAARQIAGAFRLVAPEVIMDARQVRTWAGTTDDLVVTLERQHAFSAGVAVVYLLCLRSALRSTLQG